MGILKLVTGEAPITFTVRAITDDKSKKGSKPQWKFAGATPTDPDAVIWLYDSTAERQLARFSLTRESVIGKTVAFSAVDRDGNKYINMDLVQGALALGAERSTPTPVSRAPLSPEEKKARMKRDLDLYEWCFKHVADARTTLGEEGLILTHEGLALEAQTLFQHFARRSAQ